MHTQTHIGTHLTSHAAEVDKTPLFREHGGLFRGEARLVPGRGIDKVRAIRAAEVLQRG